MLSETVDEKDGLIDQNELQSGQILFSTDIIGEESDSSSSINGAEAIELVDVVGEIVNDDKNLWTLRTVDLVALGCSCKVYTNPPSPETITEYQLEYV